MALSIDVRKLYGYLSMAAFLLLFPGFFIYHYLVARTYIPPILGGFFGTVASILILPLVLTYFKAKTSKTDRVSSIFFLLLLLNFAISIFNYLYSELYGWEYEMFLWSMSGILFNLVTYFIGYGLSIDKSIRYLISSFLIMTIIVISNIGDMGIFFVQQEAGDLAEYVASYQGFARSLVAVVLILTAYYWRKSNVFYFVVVLGLLSLFLNGARTEFAAYAATLIFVLVINYQKFYKSIIEITFFISIGLAAYIYGSDMLNESRMFQLLDIRSSDSAEARLQLFYNGLNIIIDNPIFGGYGEYVQFSGVGSYPHNIISAWVNLGIVGFIGYISMFIAMWFVVIKRRNTLINNVEFHVFLFFLIYVSITLLISKEYSDMFIGFLIGFYSRYRQASRAN
jgi:O-antigen ligase